ncbi:hypothetical protein PV327_002817 [Microctonus hyperodae]|uniref:Endonuclease/exonuclease/phosphatase domain-containing protein n=1 Tax=Microctonus hyperodae TaxID=165561 RepID=A0AA39FGK7_MICHY|nr:hypothetical protein PV327_002817 [Microctonus hyperodae]
MANVGASNKRGRENSSLDLSSANKRLNVKSDIVLNDKEIKKLQKQLGVRTPQNTKFTPNLKTTRGATRIHTPTQSDLKDFAATSNDKSEADIDDEKWETPNNTIKISEKTSESVSTITSNKFATLSDNANEINIESTSQQKKTILPIYVLAENCTIKNLATILRKVPGICGKFRLNHPTSSDFNARHTDFGDRASNRRGKYLIEWNKNNAPIYRTRIYPPANSTYIPAQTIVDLCIADNRLEINNKNFNLHKQDVLPTLDYDSDHRAILMTLHFNDSSMMNFDTVIEDKIRPYKKINWKKFGKNLIDIHFNNNNDDDNNSDKGCPFNRNLNNEEIDHYINELAKNINIALDKIKTNRNANNENTTNKFTLMNGKIRKLHKIKSKLLTALNKRRQYDPMIKRQSTVQIKYELLTVKNQLRLEIKLALENKWRNIYKKIDHITPDKFLPIIKKMIKPKSKNYIDAIHIDSNDLALISKINNNKNNTPMINNKLIITNTSDKINALAAHYELINDGLNLNAGTRLRETVDRKITEFTLECNKYKMQNKNYITNFSNSNPAYAPNKTAEDDNYDEDDDDDGDDDKAFFCNTISLQKIIKKLPNKTSAGTDGIPSIVLRNLPIKIIKELAIIFNNAINISYFPSVWKTAIVIPIAKKGKDTNNPASYRPISLTPPFHAQACFWRHLHEQLLN